MIFFSFVFFFSICFAGLPLAFKYTMTCFQSKKETAHACSGGPAEQAAWPSGIWGAEQWR